MDSVLESLVQGFKLSNGLYGGALKGLSREQLNRRCGPDSSPLIWIAGHLVLGRYGMAGFLGIEEEAPWEELFKRHSQIAKSDAYPEISSVQESFFEIGDRLVKRFPSLTVQELDSRCLRDFPIADKSLRAGLAFLAWHETYHIGQMGFLRKWLGFESLVG